MTPNPASSINPANAVLGTTPAQVVGGAPPGVFAQQLAQQLAQQQTQHQAQKRADGTARAATPTPAGERRPGPSQADETSTSAPDDAAEAGDKTDEPAADAKIDALLSSLVGADVPPTPSELRPASGAVLANPALMPGFKPGERGTGALGEAEEQRQLSSSVLRLAQGAAAAGHNAADFSADRNGTGETLPALGAPGTSALQAQAAAGQALDPDLALRSAAEAAGYPATQSAGSGLNGSASSSSSNAALAASLALATPPGVASGAAPAPLPEARLTAPPGHADFAPQLGAQISLFVREGVQQARLHLNPAELGPITVQIRLDGAGAQVLLAADHALTRQALEQAMPALAGSLREGGLTLTGGGVFDRANDPSGLTGQTGQPGHASQGGQSGQGVAGDPSRARAGQQLDGGPETNSVHDLSTPTRRGVVDLVA